jgi:hypothetical protein
MPGIAIGAEKSSHSLIYVLMNKQREVRPGGARELAQQIEPLGSPGETLARANRACESRGKGMECTELGRAAITRRARGVLMRGGTLVRSDNTCAERFVAFDFQSKVTRF